MEPPASRQEVAVRQRQEVAAKPREEKTKAREQVAVKPREEKVAKARKEKMAEPREEKTAFALSEDQARVLRLIEEGSSVLQTGPAGTGKTLTIQQIPRRPDTVFTAPTGTAACLIQGGITFHDFAGVGVHAKTPEQHAEEISKRPKVLLRWRTTQTLVIDEISMLSAELFDRTEKIARILRENDDPFGGIQLVLSGDFGQLPPVRSSTTVFDAESWASCAVNVVYLRTLFRQTKSDFIRVLQEVRVGECSPQTINALYDLGMERDPDRLKGDIEPTRLYSRRVDVEAKNNECLRVLEGDPEEFVADDSGPMPAECQAPAILRLKINAQVMLIKNLSVAEGLVNGSRGIVVRWGQTPGDPRPFPVVRFVDGAERLMIPDRFDSEAGGRRANRVQLPLTLAWAMTIHKCQGKTIDKLVIDCQGMFENGQFYVALSRARQLSDIGLLNFNVGCIRTNKAMVGLTDGSVKAGSAMPVCSSASRPDVARLSVPRSDATHSTPRPNAVPIRPNILRSDAVPVQFSPPHQSAVPIRPDILRSDAVPTQSNTPRPNAVPTRSNTPRPNAVPTRSNTPHAKAIPTYSSTPYRGVTPTRAKAVPTYSSTPYRGVTPTRAKAVPTYSGTPSSNGYSGGPQFDRQSSVARHDNVDVPRVTPRAVRSSGYRLGANSRLADTVYDSTESGEKMSTRAFMSQKRPQENGRTSFTPSMYTDDRDPKRRKVA